MEIKAKDLVVVVDAGDCKTLTNGDVHQVQRVYDDKMTLVGKGKTRYFTNRFKKVDSKKTKDNLESEDVLKVKIVKIDDDYSYFTITDQNTDILKRGEFADRELGVESLSCPQFLGFGKTLYLRGSDKHLDSKPTIISTSDILSLTKRVDAINEKYGIRKRWRAGMRRPYHYVTSEGTVSATGDFRHSPDNNRYSVGNYFKTEDDAKSSALFKIFKDLKESN